MVARIGDGGGEAGANRCGGGEVGADRHQGGEDDDAATGARQRGGGSTEEEGALYLGGANLVPGNPSARYKIAIGGIYTWGTPVSVF
jgi:hypothetical protein